MTIEALKKLTLIGDARARGAIMDKLQALGVVHLIPLGGGVPEVGPDAASDALEALRYLTGSRRKRRLQRPPQARPMGGLVDEILANKIAREEVTDRIDVITLRQQTLVPWGDFAFPPLAQLADHRLWFYRVPLGKAEQLQALELPWQSVNRDHRFLYVVVIAQSEPDEAALPFPRTHTGAESLTRLAEMREEAMVRLESLNAEREALTRWILPLTEFVDQAVDRSHLQAAEQQVRDEGEIFVLQGWVPTRMVPQLEAWIAGVPAAYQLEDPAPGDAPPTLLHNGDRVGGGEEAVAFFQLPGYGSWDPSALIFFSFALFFAMILADAGYALLLGAILLPLWPRLSTGRTAVRLRNMWLALVLGAGVYGVLIGSYFGVAPAADSLLGRLRLIDLEDFSGMMKLSIGAGVLHLMVANAMAAWAARSSPVALASLGWLLAIGGGFTLWLDYVADPQADLAASVSAKVIGGGLILIVLFSGERAVTSVTSAVLRVYDGVKALYGLSKAFGDVLSYMRLFALGLSSAALAATFNALAVSARDAAPTGGFIWFALIITLGHALNLALSLMSGVIHGLRLNLLEFYNWGIRGEGHPFNVFAKRGDARWKN